VTKKLASDFARGLANWPGFTTWRFVTNSRFGPKATAQLNTLRDQHGEGSARPVVLELWRAPEDLWWKEVSRAVYAVTVYFFDSCDIFEEPPASFEGGVPNDVAAN
jgi:hypothetical protein